MPKTIALTLNSAWNILNFRRQLVLALVQEGYRVLAIAPDAPERIKIEELGATFIPLQRLARKGTNPYRDLQLVRELTRIYRREKVDVALHYTIKPVIYGTYAAQRSGTLVINTITGLGYSFLTKSWVNQVVRRLYRRALRRAELTLFQNPDDGQLFLDAKLVPANRAALVPGSGIDTKHFLQKPLPENEPLKMLFIGRLLSDKGLREFVAAAEYLRKYKSQLQCQVLGAVDHQNPAAIDEEELAGWVAEGAIEYLGTTTDIRPFIEAATVVVLPSYREGLPRVLLEAAAMGRPLIATDVPGCREVIDSGKNGYLVSVKNAEELASAMDQMLQLSTEQRSAMGLASRQLAEQRFEIQIVVEQYLEIISKL